MRHLFIAAAACVAAITAVPAGDTPGAADDAFAYNRRLGRGVNLGNMLEAPQEGAWGLKLEADFIPKIKKAGFDSVRIPIRWSAHAQAQPLYTIDPAFLARVDQAVRQALDNNLVAVINIHHYEEMDKEPEKNLPRLVGLWRQIATHYRDLPDRVYFELLNEPHDKLTDELWQQVFPQVLAAVRESNPKRPVIIGPGHWNNVNNLPKLRLPENDRMLIGTFHYYLPFEFTHQGADWVQGSAKWLGRTWESKPQELEALRKDFAKAAEWGRQHNRPLYVGEFGAYSKADMASRARWTRAVVAEAAKHGMSTAYWEFGSGFGVYDPATGMWREPLLRALTDRPTK